jgi:SAM-dependent methyltransferase
VRFDERDMRDLPWQEEFDGVYCVGNSFAYLDDAGNEAFLAGVSRALRPGGRFLLETGVVLESILPNLARNAWYHLQDFYCLAERTHDALAGRLNVNYIFLRDGRREEKAASYRTYSYRELLRLIAESGFEHVASSGHPAGEPYATGSHDLQLVVRKPPRPPGGRPPS